MSTTIQRSYYRNGQLREEVPMRNGRRHGLVRTWHKNGVLSSEERYRQGLLHGVCRQWDERGNLLGEYRMAHGSGIQHSWFENGLIQWEHSLVEGMGTGRCRLWLHDGSLASEQWLIANREVSPAQYAKALADHPHWPKFSHNGLMPSNLSRPRLEQRAFRLHCEWLMAKANTRDAVEWLEEGKADAHPIGVLSVRRALRIVVEAIAAGARRVLAADIYSSKQGGEFADVLLVQLPKSKAHRASIRKVFLSLPSRAKCAVQPDKDSGEQFLYVYFG